MGKDYYKVLNVARSASDEDIKKAYRKLALKWHPDRCSADKKDEAQAKFQEINEAFEVLSDPEKKKIYDQVGEEGLKGGFGPSEDGAQGAGGAGPSFHFGGMPGGPSFHSFHESNPNDIFRQFFGTGDPFQAEGQDPFGGFSSFMMGGGRPGGRGMGGMPDMGGRGSSQHHHGHHHKKADPVEYPLKVTLEELFSGATKRVRITKKIADASGKIVPVAVEKEISVKPGWKDGTKITFEREGDELPGVIPADIVFIIQTKPHDRFERDGDNLIYNCPVTLHDALCGLHTSVNTLDGRTLPIEMKHVNPESTKLIPGEGMPNRKSHSKGDLRVKFKIIFPELSESERTQIGSILRHVGRK